MAGMNRASPQVPGILYPKGSLLGDPKAWSPALGRQDPTPRGWEAKDRMTRGSRTGHMSLVSEE